MRYLNLFITVFLFIFIMNSHAAFSTNVFQEPETEHVFDTDFKERYTGRKYNYEGKEVVTSNLNPVDGEHSKFNEENPYIREENNTNESSVSLSFINYIFIFALIFAVLYLIYILLNEGSTGLFSSRGNQKITNYGEITAQNIENIDVQTLIKDAENNNDFRLAIRYYYILALKTLSIKNFIKFEDDKTNAEYLEELQNQAFSQNFAYTSYLYNYIWYGEFPLDLKQYSAAKQSFTTFLKEIK